MPKSRQQKRARSRAPVKTRRRGATAFLVVMLAVLLGGGALAAIFRANPPELTRGASAGEHWHASYKIFVCGMQMTNFPNLEGEIHSHGDGFIHIHPTSPFFSGDNANLGAFLRTFETSIEVLPDGRRSLNFPGGISFTDGDSCPDDGDEGHELVVTNRGEEVGGDPSDLIVHDGDVIEIAFGPKGEEPFPNPFSAHYGHPDPGLGTGFPVPEDEGEEPPAEDGEGEGE